MNRTTKTFEELKKEFLKLIENETTLCGDEVEAVWSFISKALKEQREEIKREVFVAPLVIEDGYRRWAETHTPTWETDNLIYDLMGNPRYGVFLAKKKD